MQNSIDKTVTICILKLGVNFYHFILYLIVLLMDKFIPFGKMLIMK